MSISLPFTFKDAKSFAEKHGYTIQYSTPVTECWVKTTDENVVLFLTINKTLHTEEGILSRVIGLVNCTLGPFSIASVNFENFESQLIRLVQISL
jgi:hypothetical protein